MDTKLYYRGVVYLYKVDDSGERHLVTKLNSGTKLLSRIFAEALVGHNTSEIAPYAIDVVDKYGASILVSISLLQNRHAESGFQDTYEGLPFDNYRAYFDAQIEKSQIRANSAQSADRLVMLNKQGGQLASISLTEDSENMFADIFSSNNNLIVIWQMELVYDKLFEEVPDEYR